MHTGATYRLICDTFSEPGCLLLTVTDDAGRAVGEATVSLGDTWQLKSFRFPPRNAIVAAALWHSIVRALRINRVRRFAATVDRPTREFLASVGLYLVTDSVPELLDRQRRVSPEGYRLITQGQGLDDVELPYPGELVTAPAVAPFAG